MDEIRRLAFWRRCKIALVTKGYTQRDVAEDCNTPLSTVHFWMRGRKPKRAQHGRYRIFCEKLGLKPPYPLEVQHEGS